MCACSGLWGDGGALLGKGSPSCTDWSHWDRSHTAEWLCQALKGQGWRKGHLLGSEGFCELLDAPLPCKS